MITEADIERMRPFRNFIENKWTKRCDDAKRIPDVIHDELPTILAQHRIDAIESCIKLAKHYRDTNSDINQLIIDLEGKLK